MSIPTYPSMQLLEMVADRVMACAIVKFRSTQEVAVIPINWIRGNMCLWPPKNMRFKLSGLIEKGTPVTASEACDAFPIECMGIYATYKEARAKLPKAQEKSDINTTDSEDQGKGKRSKIKRKLSTSSTESEEMLTNSINSSQLHKQAPHLSQLYKPPPDPSHLYKPASKSPLFYEEAPDPVELCEQEPEPECSFSLSTEKSSESLLNASTTLKRVKATSSNEAFQRTVLRELQIIKCNQKIIMDALDTFKKCPPSSNVSSNDTSLIDELVELLPVASDLHFSIIEEKLADEKSSHQMISYLSRIGGVQCEQGVKFMLRKVLTDEVACTFSLMGLRGKKAFQTTNICKAIMGSVRNNPSWKDVQEKEVERFISNWLRHAKGRIQQRKLRLIK